MGPAHLHVIENGDFEPERAIESFYANTPSNPAEYHIDELRRVLPLKSNVNPLFMGPRRIVLPCVRIGARLTPASLDPSNVRWNYTWTFY